MPKHYSLKESKQKLGVLPIPILTDQEGEILDGFHRKMAGIDAPEVAVAIKNELQRYIVMLVANCCRRRVSAEEKTEYLAQIAERSGWTPKEIADRLPFSYHWVMKYLPNRYKNMERAKAGAKGGKASGSDFALRRQANVKVQREKLLDNAREMGLPQEDVDAVEKAFQSLDRREEKTRRVVEAVEEEPEQVSPEEFAENFNPRCERHVKQLVNKDFPTLMEHKGEDCGSCLMKPSCDALLEMVQGLRKQLPPCMAEKLELDVQTR